VRDRTKKERDRGRKRREEERERRRGIVRAGERGERDRLRLMSSCHRGSQLMGGTCLCHGNIYINYMECSSPPPPAPRGRQTVAGGLTRNTAQRQRPDPGLGMWITVGSTAVVVVVVVVVVAALAG